jgi:hypothetical protein
LRYNSRSSAIAIRQFAFPSNSSSSATPTQDTIRNFPNFVFPPIPIPILRGTTCQRDIICISLRFAFPSNPSSHSSNSFQRTGACMGYNAFPPIPLRVHHADAPAAENGMQLASCAIPIRVLCWRSNSLARDTIHVPLQIQLIFIMLQLALHHLHKIQFAFSPNSNSNFPFSNSCWRHKSESSRSLQFQLFFIVPARQPPLEKTILTPLQLFEIQFAFPSDSSSSWCKRTSWIQLKIQYAFSLPFGLSFLELILARSLRYILREFPIAAHHAGAPASARENNSRFSQFELS